MGERVRGWWYPYIFLALLGIVIVVNGTMAYLATTTFNGVITEGAYEKGNDYNRVLAAAKEQAQMGWAVKTEVIPGSVGHAAEITVSFKNKDGKAIDGLDVQALADRPNVNGAEHRSLFGSNRFSRKRAVGFRLFGVGRWEHVPNAAALYHTVKSRRGIRVL